jgi:methyl-accepting chemotaxis protein
MLALSSIRGRLIAVGVACTAAAAGLIAVVNYWAVHQGAQASINRYGTAVATANAISIANWVSDKKVAVQEMARAINAPDIAAAVGSLQRAAGVELGYMGMADGTFHRGTPGAMPPGYDPTKRPWYQLAAGANGPVLTAPYVDASTKQLVVTFANAVREGGTVKAVAGADVSLKGMAELVSSIKPSPLSFATLVTRDGRLLVSPRPELAMKPTTEWSPDFTPARMQAALQPENKQEVVIGGERFWVAGAPVEGTDWLLLLVLNRSEALMGAERILSVSLTSTVIVTALAALVIAVVVGAIMRRLVKVQVAMDEIGSGHADLRARLNQNGNDELARIAAGFNAFVDSLSKVFGQIRGSSESVRQSASEIAAGNQDLSERTEQTASSIQSAAARINSLSGAVRQSADSARQADSMTGDAAATAERGGQVVREVVTTMNGINESSRKIADIIGVIDGIAFQTNILALNAAVEAARAGEQGRGFAVVASEVRSLAQRSAAAAKEIKQLIDESVGRVEAGAALVGRAGSTMDEIVQAVQVMSATVKEISTSAEDQRRDIELITHEMNQLDQVTQQNAALVEQSAAAATSLREEADRLAHVLDGFKT